MYYQTVSQILPRLYLTDLCSANDTYVLARYGITHIINLSNVQLFTPTKKRIPRVEKTERTLSSGQHIDVLNINIEDSTKTSIADYFDIGSNFIHDAMEKENHNVLVHCVYGVSRSPTMVIAYLVEKHGYRLNAAFATIYNKANNQSQFWISTTIA